MLTVMGCLWLSSGYVGCTWLLMVLFDLLVVAALSVLAAPNITKR
jgi:hypothetical protein